MEISKGTAARLSETASNPANTREVKIDRSNRVPMSVPTPTLATPSLPSSRRDPRIKSGEGSRGKRQAARPVAPGFRLSPE